MDFKSNFDDINRNPINTDFFISVNIKNTQVVKPKRINLKNKISISNESTHVNKINEVKTKLNKSKTHISKENLEERKAKKTDAYHQNTDKSMGLMNAVPPTLPSIFNHNYNLERNITNNSISFGKLNKELIPVPFYNHFMVAGGRRLIDEKKYIQSTITQRNKKKLLTIVYFTPKK